MSISNFVFGSSTLKFDDVFSAIHSKEMRWKSFGETSSNPLTVETRGRKWKEERAQDITVSQGKADPSPNQR